jgi:3',5'-cyclic AMP phosphodiesterase CpdA
MRKGGHRTSAFSYGIFSVRRVQTAFILALAHFFALAQMASAYDKNFLVKPYLQLGYEGKHESSGLDLVWLSESAKHKWQVIYLADKSTADKSSSGKNTSDKSSSDKSTSDKSTSDKDGSDKGKAEKGHEAEWITERMISLPGFSAPYYKLTAHLNKLPAGGTFQYKVLEDGKEVFNASAKSRKHSGQSSHVALFGDCGINGEGQRKLSKQVAKADPDLVLILGDIAYQQGLFSQYLTNFFPVYNLDPAKPSDDVEEKRAQTFPVDDGIASMRSSLWAGVIGNHDISLSGYGGTNINRYPDCLAYYIFWNEPLNGFKVGDQKIKKNYSFLDGDLNRQELFKKSAGDAYPLMNNYSFDYGDAHFVALDGNYYMDWTDAKLRAWLAEDLKAAQGKAWRILLMHQPPFLVGAAHWNEQKMRYICDIAQKYKVNMVIAGHSHCYERSMPLNFQQSEAAKPYSANVLETVDGKITLDKNFDGAKNTRPDGIIYIVSGAGGAKLYPIEPSVTSDPNRFMTHFDHSSHSFSSLDIDDKQLSFKQINEDGNVIDQFVVTK